MLSGASAVRKLRVCVFCWHPGTGFLKIGNRQYAHGYCLVKNRGFYTLAALSDEEVGKINVSDLGGLGLSYEAFMRRLCAARRRLCRKRP